MNHSSEQIFLHGNKVYLKHITLSQVIVNEEQKIVTLSQVMMNEEQKIVTLSQVIMKEEQKIVLLTFDRSGSQ